MTVCRSRRALNPTVEKANVVVVVAATRQTVVELSFMVNTTKLFCQRLEGLVFGYCTKKERMCVAPLYIEGKIRRTRMKQFGFEYVGKVANGITRFTIDCFAWLKMEDLPFLTLAASNRWNGVSLA